MSAPGFARGTHFDVVLVGAGPAGCAFLRTLGARGSRLRVLTLEQSAFPRDKVCGDALTHLSVPLLRHLFPKVAAALLGRSSTRRYTLFYENGVRLQNEDQELDVIPRRELDAALWESVSSVPHKALVGARALSVSAPLEGSGHRVVSFEHGGARCEVTAALVVGADGANGVVRRATGAIGQDNRQGVVRQYVRGVPRHDDGLVFFVDTEARGYFWVFPFQRGSERWANVGCGSIGQRKNNPRQQFDRWLATPGVRPYLEGGEPVGAPRGFPIPLAPTRSGRVRLTRSPFGQGYVLLGDAACLVQPHTGEGISMALYSGHLAASLVSEQAPGESPGAEYGRALEAFIHRAYSLRTTALMLWLPCLLPRAVRFPFLRALPLLDSLRSRRRPTPVTRRLSVLPFLGDLEATSG